MIFCSAAAVLVVFRNDALFNLQVLCLAVAIGHVEMTAQVY